MRVAVVAIVLGILWLPASATKIVSHVLDLNEKFLDVMNEGIWFIKFYAPWCAHCKRLGPTWEHLGHALSDMNSPVRVGKVDCTRFTSVATALRINAYPTLILFRNGHQIPYDGDRKKEALIDFVIKSSGPVVSELSTAVQYSELRKTADKDPFFVFVGTGKDASEKEQQLFAQYEAAAEQLFTESRFLRTNSVSVFPTSVILPSRPAIVTFKDGSYYVFDESKDDLQHWAQTERWPLMPHASPSNIHSLGKTEKKLVLVISDLVDRNNASSPIGQFYKTARDAAKLVREDNTLNSLFQFGWLDGDTIANNIIMGQVGIPDLIVFNQSSYEFYLCPDSPAKITSKSIVTFLKTVANGDVDAMGGRAWNQRLKRMAFDITTNIYDMFQHQPILTVCLFGVPLAFFAIITYSICSADFSVDRDEIYPDDDDDSEADLQDEVHNDIEDESGNAPRRRHVRRSSSSHSNTAGRSNPAFGEDTDASGEQSEHEKAD